jgi:hypothetical protein
VKVWPLLTVFLVGCALTGYTFWRVYSGEFAAVQAQKDALARQNGELAAIARTQGEALERVRTEAAEQADRVAKAQTEAAKVRAQSEARVQVILTAPELDDSHELVVWAAREAKDLVKRLK